MTSSGNVTIHSAAAASRRLVKRTLRHAAALTGRIRRRTNDGLTPRVLCYHGVCAAPVDEWSVTPAQLRWQMELLRQSYRPVPLEAVVGWARGEQELEAYSVAVTFDDGFADVHEHAAPIMADYDVPGAAFVPSMLMDGGSVDPSYRPSRPFMNWSQVRELAAQGWTVGSHCLDHPRLSALDEAGSRRQLVGSREALEQELQQPVTLLAYPYGTPGTVSDRDRRLAEEAGYTAGFMAVTGEMSRDSDLWALPRAKVLGTDSTLVVEQSLTGGMDIWRHIEGTH